METTNHRMPDASKHDAPGASASEWLTMLENRHTQNIQLGLERIREVASTLDLLKPSARVITVAGTNGKGSTVAALEAIYCAAGYQVACYTSPHLLSFNERIRINQQPISDAQLVDAFELIEAIRGSVHLTYFEVTTLAAWWHFKKHTLDLIILEVGLGGRLDATNLMNPDLAIITTIDLDHQAFLGDTREAIGREKAGILRSKRPFIFADTSPPQSILDAVTNLGCIPYFFDLDYSYQTQTTPSAFIFKSHPTKLTAVPSHTAYSPLPILQPKLHSKAMAAAIQASLILDKTLPVLPEQIQEGLQGLHLSGRLEWVSGPVVTLLDVAHNPQAASYLAEQLKMRTWKGKVHAVFSALADKDLSGLIHPLLGSVQHWYPACLPENRAASREQLSDAFKTYGIMDSCFENPRVAYEYAYRHAVMGDLILVYGSFYTVANVYSTVYKHHPP